MPEKLSKTPQLSKDVSSAKFIFANGNIYDGEFTLNDSGSIVRKGFGTFTCQYGVKRLKYTLMVERTEMKKTTRL